MAREKATLEAVREAYELLGKDATLTKLVEMVGGSRSTVLKRRRAIVGETGEAEMPDAVRGYLQQQTKPIMERLWREALDFASQSFEMRTQTAMTIQAELIVSLRAAKASEAEALQRAAAAERMVEQLQSELAGRKSAEQQMAALAKMFRSGTELGGTPVDEPQTMQPIDKLLELLQPRPMHPRDYRRHMKEAGYSSHQASQAKAESIKRTYVLIDKEGFLELTALGHDRRRLGPKRRVA